MQKRMKKIVKIFCTTIIFWGCVFARDYQDQNNQDPIEIVALPQDISLKAQEYCTYMKACVQHFTGDYPGATKSFEKSIKLSDYAYDGAIRFFYESNQFDEIIKLENKIEKIFKDDSEIQRILAEAYLNQSHLKKSYSQKAEKLFNKLVEKNPDNEQISYYVAVSYIKNNKLDTALKFIEKCIARPGLKSKHFLFYFLGSKIYLQKGMNDKAHQFISKSLEIYPNFEKGWLLKAILEEQRGRVGEAITGYKNFLNLVGRDLTIEKQLVHLLFSAERFSEAADTLRNIKGDSAEYFFDLALIDWKANNYSQALENIDKSLQKLSDFKKAKLLKIEILLALKDNKRVLDFIENWIKSTPKDDSVIHVALLLKRSGITQDSLIEVFEGIFSSGIQSESISLALADLYLEKNNYDKVLSYCKKIYKSTKDETLKSRILFQIGFVYFHKGESENVEKYLKMAIKHKPTYPSAYNLLAYHYAQNDKNLERALKLANIALNSNPDCYYYLDTKGYVFLKMGKIKEAIKFFEDALKLAQSEDKVVLQHLDYARSVDKNN